MVKIDLIVEPEETDLAIETEEETDLVVETEETDLTVEPDLAKRLTWL